MGDERAIRKGETEWRKEEVKREKKRLILFQIFLLVLKPLQNVDVVYLSVLRGLLISVFNFTLNLFQISLFQKYFEGFSDFFNVCLSPKACRVLISIYKILGTHTGMSDAKGGQA